MLLEVDGPFDAYRSCLAWPVHLPISLHSLTAYSWGGGWPQLAQITHVQSPNHVDRVLQPSGFTLVAVNAWHTSKGIQDDTLLWLDPMISVEVGQCDS